MAEKKITRRGVKAREADTEGHVRTRRGASTRRGVKAREADTEGHIRAR